jgi:DNA repair exonuclease SbcCD ATPase subunit
MEEDIKILEERITMLKRHIKYYEESDCLTDVYQQLVKECRAIENLLKERQSDKERIKELEKENESLVRQYEYQGALMVNEYFSKDQVFKLFVPKSLIKEKIEEYKAKTDCRYCNNSCDSYAVCKVLEELLKGE